MVDIAGSHPSITAADFIFRVGNNNSPGTWATANAPTSISVRAGAGVSGSDRVEIIWNGAAAPIKQWLEVIVLANANTGLAQKVGYPVGQATRSSSAMPWATWAPAIRSPTRWSMRSTRLAIRANNALLSRQHSDHEHLRCGSQCQRDCGG